MRTVYMRRLLTVSRRACLRDACAVNKLQRQLEGLLHNLRLIEQRLESKGITLRDLGITPVEAVGDWARIYSRSPSSTGTSLDRQHSSHMQQQAAVNSSPTSNIVGSRRERPLSAHSNSLSEVYAK